MAPVHCLTDQMRQRLCDWLRANDVDPNNIPEGAPLSFAGGRLTAEVFVRDAQGKLQRAFGGDELRRETATFTMSTPPPADVARWMQGGVA